MNRILCFAIILILCFSVGCGESSGPYALADTMIVSENDTFFLDSDGNVRTVRLVGERLEPANDVIDAYDWDAYNADYGPFLDVTNVYAKRLDGSWVRCPNADSLSVYKIGKWDSHGTIPSTELCTFLNTFTGEQEGVWVWLTDVVEDEEYGLNGTVKLVAKDLAYTSEYYTRELTFFPEILYGEFDLSDCKNATEATKKLLETCSGEVFFYRPGYDYYDEYRYDPCLLFRGPYDFSKSRYLDPADYPRDDTDPNIVKMLGRSWDNDRVVLYADGTVDCANAQYPISETWTDIRDIGRNRYCLFGVREDGTVCYELPTDAPDWFYYNLEHARYFDLSLLSEMKNVKKILFNVEDVPIFLTNDGDLIYPLSLDVRSLETTYQFPQYGYADGFAQTIVMELDEDFGPLYVSLYYLRCLDGSTVVLQRDNGYDLSWYDSTVIETVYD